MLGGAQLGPYGVTGLYMIAQVGLGLCVASFGPILLALARNTHSAVTDMSPVFASRSVGILVGSLAGPLYDWAPSGHGLMAFFVALCGASVALMSVASSIPALAFLIGLEGLSLGVLAATMNLQILRLFRGSSANTAMQMLHAAFPIGGLVSPAFVAGLESTMGTDRGWPVALLVYGIYCAMAGALFLAVRTPPKPTLVTDSKGGSASVGSLSSASTTSIDQLHHDDPESGHVPHHHSSYDMRKLHHDDDDEEEEEEHASSSSTGTTVEKSMDGTPAPVVSVGPSTVTPSVSAGTSVTPVAPGTAPKSMLRRVVGDWSDPAVRAGWLTVLCASLQLGVYVGSESAFGNLLTAYTVHGAGGSEQLGQTLTTVFWASIGVGRGSGIFLSRFLRPQQMLGGSVGGCLATAILFIAAPHAVWPVTILFGMCMGGVFPTTMALVETYTPLTGSQATSLIIGTSLGDMIIPAAISASFGQTPDGAIAHPLALPMALVGTLTLLVAVLASTMWRGTISRKFLTVTPPLPAVPAISTA